MNRPDLMRAVLSAALLLSLSAGDCAVAGGIIFSGDGSEEPGFVPPPAIQSV